MGSTLLRQRSSNEQGYVDLSSIVSPNAIQVPVSIGLDSVGSIAIPSSLIGENRLQNWPNQRSILRQRIHERLDDGEIRTDRLKDVLDYIDNPDRAQPQSVINCCGSCSLTIAPRQDNEAERNSNENKNCILF